jgi:hypothetical protein
MFTPINFIAFWILTTFAIRLGNPIGIVLCIAGFLVMHLLCEEMDQKENNNYLIGIKESND